MLSLGYMIHESLGSGGTAAVTLSNVPLSEPSQCILPAISARECPTVISAEPQPVVCHRDRVYFCRGWVLEAIG